MSLLGLRTFRSITGRFYHLLLGSPSLNTKLLELERTTFSVNTIQIHPTVTFELETKAWTFSRICGVQRAMLSINRWDELCEGRKLVKSRESNHYTGDCRL
jgi:hypothetical protein